MMMEGKQDSLIARCFMRKIESFRRAEMLGVVMAGIVLSAVAPPPANADFQTGNSILPLCRKFQTMMETNITTADGLTCGGYVQGIVDVLLHQSVYGKNICTHENVRLSQYIDAIVSYLQKRPDIRHYAGYSLVAAALSETFPCPR